MKSVNLNWYLVLLLGLFGSCQQQDNFYIATKTIEIPDTIQVGKQFSFSLILKNDSLNEMKFTIDQVVQNSLFFNPDFFCDTTLLLCKVANPKVYKHNYKEDLLKKGDSFSFNFSGILVSLPNDSLALKIIDYDRIFKLKNPHCKNFNFDLSGMWIPGSSWAFDAMEGYNFRKSVAIKQE